MKSIINLRIFFELIFILISLIAIWQGELILYGLAQGKGQLNIIFNTRPINKILKDPSFPDSLKNKLILIQEVKKFAIDSLGLNFSENYNTFYNQKGKTLLWVLTASEPYRLKAKEWNFPLLGNVSYKGFFVKQKAQEEERKLKMDNYDTDIGIVSGWSTLGWFKDPVLSNMLTKSESALVNLIIHELTHGTLYIKDNVSFNENLAGFIAEIGTVKFLENKYPSRNIKQDNFIEIYKQNNKEKEIINTYFLNCSTRLDSLYKTFNENDSLQFKEKAKHEMLFNIVKGLYLLPVKNKEKSPYLGKRILLEKNAFFISFLSYQSKQDFFEKEYKESFNSDIKKYMTFLKKKYPSI